jgi:hypothetical protein
VNLIEAMSDPAMFAPWFQGTSWNAWRAVLKGAFALPMDEDDHEVFGRLAGGRAPPTKRVRELWVISGRRSGKDSVASGICAWAASIEQGHIGKLRPGEMGSVLLLACDRSQSRIVQGYINSYFATIDDLKCMVANETRDGLELSNSAEIVIATNNFRQTRGRTVLLAILDECAFYRDESSATPDIEVYRAILPSMATLPDAMLVGISSPYRKSGLLYDKWKAHYGKDDDKILVIQAESTQLNPTLDPAIVAEALEADPAAARAEWLGQWRDDIAGYLSIELIESAVDAGVLVRPPKPGLRYVGYADAASGTGADSFAIGIAHAEADTIYLDLANELRPPFNPQSATADAAKLFKSYGINQVRGDKYAAGFVVEAFARAGVKYEYSDNDTSENYLNALPLFTAGRVRLIDNKRLVSQFAGLERRTTVSGRDRVDHGSGDRHDDISAAVSGALVLAATPKQVIPIVAPYIYRASEAHPAHGGAGDSFAAIGGRTIMPDFDTPRSW